MTTENLRPGDYISLRNVFAAAVRRCIFGNLVDRKFAEGNGISRIG